MSTVLSPLALVFVGVPVAVVTVLLIAAAVLAVRRSRAITFDEERYPGLAALRRATLRSRYVGIACSVIVFAALGRFGQGLFVAPSAAGVVVIAAILVGQRLTYTRARTVGSAGVERRQVGDYLPARLRTIATALLLVLVAVAAWTTFAATPDVAGLARAFTHPCTTHLLDQEQVHVSTSTPFPGGYYTAGMAISSSDHEPKVYETALPVQLPSVARAGVCVSGGVHRGGSRSQRALLITGPRWSLGQGDCSSAGTLVKTLGVARFETGRSNTQGEEASAATIRRPLPRAALAPPVRSIKTTLIDPDVGRPRRSRLRHGSGAQEREGTLGRWSRLSPPPARASTRGPGAAVPDSVEPNSVSTRRLGFRPEAPSKAPVVPSCPEDRR